MNKTELKPCPFCGKEVDIREVDGDWIVDCFGCRVMLDHIFITESEAITAWNTRTADKKLEGLSDEVIAFAKTMQYKLDKNKHKSCDVMNLDGNGRGWEHCHFTWLHSRIIEEAEELFKALRNRIKDPDAVLYECADVANFAMMIHDKTLKETNHV